MNQWLHRIAAGTLLAASAGLIAVAGTGAHAAPKKIKLFNGKNFDGLYTYINGDGKNNDPEHIFTIEDGGVIHALGKKFGYVGTQNEYENYRMAVDFKWGEKKWPPRENDRRDAGVLYHCVGEDKVWMKSLECQIQEQDCGDMWLTGGQGGAPSLTVKSKPTDANGKEFIFDPDGEDHTITGGRVVKRGDGEKPTGEWNHVEVVADGDKIQHFINGKLVMEGHNASLTKGKLNIQSEGAEIYYRNWTLEPLK